MAGKQSNRSRSFSSKVFSGDTPGENPVINEKFEPLYSLDELRAQRLTVLFPEKDGAGETNDAGKQPSELAKVMYLFRMERWEDALQELLQVDGSSLSGEGQAERSYYMGLCCTKLERFDDALLHLEQFIAASGDSSRIHQSRLILALIFIKTGRAKMAELELERLLSSGIESIALYNTLAYASYVRKQHMKAIEYYEKVLDVDKDNVTAMNSLGFILADTGLDKQKALKLCRKAVEINPQNAAYLDSLGWALYKSGRPSEARSLLRQALDISPREEEIKKHYRVVSGGGY